MKLSHYVYPLALASPGVFYRVSVDQKEGFSPRSLMRWGAGGGGGWGGGVLQSRALQIISKPASLSASVALEAAVMLWGAVLLMALGA